MEQDQVETKVESMSLVETRKNRRLFILFLVIDVILLGIIVYEIIASIKNGLAAKEAAKQAEEAAKKAAEAAQSFRYLF